MRMPESSNARLRLGLLCSIPLAFSILFFVINLSAEHNDTRIVIVQQLHSRVGALRGISNDAEVGEHGYLLSNDERYLAILQGATARVATVDSSIRAIPVERDFEPEVDKLLAMVRDRVKRANHVMDVERESGQDAALALARTEAASQLMGNIRSAVDDLQKRINDRTAAHLDYDHKLTRWAFLSFLFGTFTMLLLTVWLYHSFLLNISSRDAAHAELKALNADLERRIEERTHELRRFNEELQQFAYVASHDLQEPLRTVTSFAQLLSTRYAGRLDADADEFISYIVNSARRMTDLINGLLALVRLRKAGQPVEPVDLGALVSEAQMGLQTLIRENDARVECGDLPSLVVDRVQFAQVFQNLISNGIKYRSPETPKLTITARRDISSWTIAIADNGRGFDPQFAERIFGLFQRLHGREVDGTGMGLSIAKRIVERHGGRMWAESSEGAGSTFFISLPFSLEARPGNEADLAGVGAHSSELL